MCGCGTAATDTWQVVANDGSVKVFSDKASAVVWAARRGGMVKKA